MKVSPTPAAAPPTATSSGTPGRPPSNGNGSSNSGATSSTQPEQKPYRAHDHQPALSADAVIASQREQTDRLERLVEKLSRVVTDPKGATAAIGSPSTPSDKRQSDFDRIVQREIELGKLERTVLSNGHVTYRLPLNSVRNLGYELVGKRDAFIDRGEHIEVAGSGREHLRAAALHAARKWGNEPVVIYAEGKHLNAVIEHAVRAGLNIANEHPTVVAKVAAERQRQADPLGRERASTSARAIRDRDVAPIIARVRSV